MKRFGQVLLPLLLAALVPTLLSAETKKMTVAQLQDALTALHNAQKPDDQVANELKQIQLTEELTQSAMNDLMTLVNGPLSTEQIYVLEARSSMLAPPETDLPKTAAPDAAAQQAMLTKAQDYATKTYTQMPRLTATRLVARFQDGVETIQSYYGANAKTVSNDDPIWQQVNQSVRLMNTHTDTVEIENGVDKSAEKDNIQWGRNGVVNSMLPFIPLNVLTSEAVSLGSPKFLRWETIAGHPSAVYAFAVDKKKSHYAVNYCCFPDTSSVGNVLYGGHGNGGGSAAQPVGGNLNSGPLASGHNNSLASVSNWTPFNAKVGYHGELFLDPDSGVILRTIVQADLKPSEFVHSENIRVDYAPMPVGSANIYVPVRSFTTAEVVPNGDSYAARYSTRNQFMTQDFKDFEAAPK